MCGAIAWVSTFDTSNPTFARSTDHRRRAKPVGCPPKSQISKFDPSLRTLLGVTSANSTSSSTNGLTIPRELETFPSLAPNLRAASIAKSVPTTGPPKLSDPQPTHNVNRDDEASLESTLLAATDDAGMMYLFIEGSYPLGDISLGDSTSVRFLDKMGEDPTLFTRTSRSNSTSLQADVIHFPLLLSDTLTNITKLSTSVRALLTYLFHSLEEMRRAWFGTDTLEGGRDVGRKWIKVLQEKDKMFAACTLVAPIDRSGCNDR